MKRVTSYCVLITFICYWLTTFFFTAPDNYMKISQLGNEVVFRKYFFQEWAFFAPPPISDDRLYCIIYKKEDSSRVSVFELIEPIINEKIEKAPFNSKSDLLDYIVSNNFIGLNDEIRVGNELIEQIQKDRKLSGREKDSILIACVENSPQFKTLKNYARSLVRNKGIESEDYLMSIRLTNIPMPKFGNRNKSKEKKEELLIYQSQLF